MRDRERAGLLVLLAVTALAYAATIRPGHTWHDDFATYVSHARNILDERPYEQTGYLYNPAAVFTGPRIYPPVYPVMLAPVYALRGVDLGTMKLQIVVTFVAWLLLLHMLARRLIGPGPALAVTALTAINPFFWELKNSVLADIPAAMFTFAAMLLIDDARRRDEATSVARGVAAGLLAYLAYGTRTLAGVLIPAMLLADLVRGRRVGRFSIIATIAFAVPAALQSFLLPGEGYVEVLSLWSPRLVAVSAWRYLRSLEGLTTNGYVGVLGVLLGFALAVLAVAGYIKRARRELGFLEIFIALYLLVIVVWPIFQSLRFLVPIVPLLLVYAYEGCTGIAGSRGRTVAAVAAGALVLSAAGTYTRVTTAEQPDGVRAPAAIAMLRWIEANTDLGDVVLTQRPRAIAMYTGRRATSVVPDWSDEQVRAYARRVGADVIVTGAMDGGLLDRFARRNPRAARRAFVNDRYRIYRIR